MIIGGVVGGVIRPPVRGYTLNKGVPGNAITLNRIPITLNGQFITLAGAA